ncbi:DUF885 domain-containing protein [bacterium]|nr:DUF885 domain-containing protein [bacterium]
MKKVTIFITLLFFALGSTGLLFSQQNQMDTKFQEIVDEYLDELWKFYPTSATMAGFHDYDKKLENLKSGKIENRRETLEELNQKFVAEVDQTKLSPEVKINHQIIVDALERELILHENLLPWEYDPIFYNHILVNSIKSLLTGDFAPMATRAKNARERLEDIPRLIKQARKNLKTPPKLFTETAIKQFPGVLNFYKNEIPTLIEEAPSDLKSDIQSRLQNVIPELEQFQTYLKEELLPKSTGNFRLGEAHRRLVRRTFQNKILLDQLIARAKTDYKNLRREMFLVCIPFYKIMNPKIDIENPPSNLTEEQLKNTVISHVFDKIEKDHPTQEKFVDEIKTFSDEVKTFMSENQIFELPEKELSLELMPLEYRRMGWTRLITPPVYGEKGNYTCQISPIPNDLKEDKVQSLLQEYNNYLLPSWILRNVYPGKFIPLNVTRENSSSLLRKLYPNKPLIKGWPLIIEDTLVNSGFGNYDLRVRLNQLKLRLRAVIDFILEFNIHEGGMTKDQAISYMTRGGFQSEAEAERKWNQIVLNPGKAAFAYVGLQELLDIEKEYKKMKGDDYNRKEFFRKVLEHGAIPIRHLYDKVLQEQP